MPFDPTSLSLYPIEPGIYLMKDSSGAILYIGKAKNLRTRLRQYFSEQDQREMIPFLISQIAVIDTIVALTEKDALLLENNLIKKHQPKFNILLKDDKTFISLCLTKHKWPMIRLLRYKGTPKEEGAYFGPYTNALAARATHDLLLKLFPLRQCSDSELAARKRPCLLYDIKRCCAPCVEKCTKEEYDGYVESAKRLLKGQDRELLRELKHRMQAAANALEFEKADHYLQSIRQIEHVTTVQHVDNPFAKDCDVIGLFREADAVLIALLLFREGKIIASEHFSFHRILSEDDELLESFLLQHYKLQTSWPKEILLPTSLPEAHTLAEILAEWANHKIAISTPKIGKKKDLLEMAYRNAKALFVREQDARSLREKRLLDLQETLQLTRFPRRIECFDTSNIAGTDPVASLVTFVNGERDPKRMRLFKIKSPKGDDYSSLREVIYRYYLQEKEKSDFCDLLIVDGGKGQLNIALDVFQELGIASIDAIGVSKDQARHDKGLTQEKIYLPHRTDPLLLDPRSPLLFLLQTIRDEAHRVAIGYHRKRRAKRLTSSELDSLSGIGPVKKKRLLTHFGSVKAIQNATEAELREIKNLNKKDLETLRKWKLSLQK